MGVFARLLGSLFGAERAPDNVRGIPVIRFDGKGVTKEVKADIRAAIDNLPEIPTQLRPHVYDLAIESISRGRDLGFLTKALLLAEIPGVDKANAARIARNLNNRATALMAKNRAMSDGIQKAKWLHAGPDCFRGMDGMEGRAASHAQANGKIYMIAEGLEIDGIHTWPGREEGCICVSNLIIPGFD